MKNVRVIVYEELITVKLNGLKKMCVLFLINSFRFIEVFIRGSLNRLKILFSYSLIIFYILFGLLIKIFSLVFRKGIYCKRIFK